MASIEFDIDGRQFAVFGENNAEVIELYQFVRGMELYPSSDGPQTLCSSATVSFEIPPVSLGGVPSPSGTAPIHNVEKETAEKWERIVEAARVEERDKCRKEWPIPIVGSARTPMSGPSSMQYANPAEMQHSPVRTVTPDELLKIAADAGMPPAKAEALKDFLGKGGGGITLNGQHFEVEPPKHRGAPGEGGRPFISPDAFKFGVRAAGTTSGRS